MKKLILSAFLATFILGMEAFAATTQTSINLGPFKSINVSGAFSVSLVRGTDYRVLVTVEDAYKDYLVCRVNSGVLSIGIDDRLVPMDVKLQFRGKGTPDPVFTAVVYLPELIQAVNLSDKAVLLDSEDVFDKGSVSFELKGSSCVKGMELSSQTVRINMLNKSTADFRLQCNALEVSCTNSVKLNMEDASESSVYSLQGSSKVVAKSRSANVSIKTKANSSMTLYGSGDVISYELGGTSEVDASGFDVPDAKVNMSSVCTLRQSAYRSLTLNLNGGSTLMFANDPQISIENIKSSTVTRTGTTKKSNSTTTL